MQRYFGGLLIIFWLGGLPLSGQPISERFITLHEDEVILEQVLDQLSEQYALQFFYLPEWLPEDSLAIHVDEASLPQVLSQLLSPALLSYTYYDTHSIVIAPSNLLSGATTYRPQQTRPSEPVREDSLAGIEAYELDEVLLEAEANRNVSSALSGVDQLSIREIKRLPAFMGEIDVIKSILLLPGVSTVGEGAGGFNVRGGTIDQNLILQDEAPVFNASHVLGFFSIFNSDVVEQLTLYKGNIPAQLGGRLSSVLDIRLKDGNYQEFKARGGIGAVASRAVIEGPFQKGRSSYLLGLRSSYSAWALRLVQNPDVRASAASFYDVNAKISQRLGKQGSLHLSAYASNDRFQFASQYGYGWRTQLLSAQWRNLMSAKLSSTTTALYGNYVSEYFDPEGQDAFTLENGLQYYKFKHNFLWLPSPAHTLHIGAAFTHYKGRPEQIGPRGSESGIRRREVPKDQGRELALYINDTWELGSFVALSLGLRYSLYQNVGPDTVLTYREGGSLEPEHVIGTQAYESGEVISQYGGWEPRISLRVNVNENSSVKVSYNRLRQYIHLISNTTAATPVDIWQVSNTYVPPQIADNYSVGYFRNFNGNRWETSLEFYYKDIHQLIEYKDLPDLLLNEYLETELISGIGRAYGGELSIKRKAGAVTGWFSYAYARSLRQVRGEFSEEIINEGEWYPAQFDQPHQLNAVVTYKIGKKHTFSANFTYSSGRPITAPIADYFIGNTLIPHYSARNQVRIPDYHRLDFSYTIDPQAVRRQRFKSTITFTLYNLYARKNPFSVYFQRTDKFLPDAFKLAVLGSVFPSVTYNFNF